MVLPEKSCKEFVELLGSKEPVPGGGGAAALIAAVGTALGSMVCNLTIGKKKFLEFDEKLKDILRRAEILQKELLEMIDADGEAFLPLSKAYGMAKDTEDEKRLKEETMERCLKDACDVPVKILKLSFQAIKLHEELVDNCSKLAISDVGVGVQALRAALLSARLNIIININSIKDQVYVDNIKNVTEPIAIDGVKIADKVYEKVIGYLS